MTAARASTRAFTLLEVMLALALASMVALSAYGLFDVLRRSEQRQHVRMSEAEEVARTYRAMERAFRTLVMSNTGAPEERELQERMREFERAVDNDDPDPPIGDDDPQPRLILRPDPTSPFIKADVEGRRTRMKAQVLELALRAPPVLGARPEARIFETDFSADGRRGGRDARRGLEHHDPRDDDESVVEAADTEDEDETVRELPVIAPGVRGVFELIPDGIDPLGAIAHNEGLDGWRPRPTADRGYTLWWRELPPPPPEDDEEPEGERDDEDEDRPARSLEVTEADQLLLLASTRRVPLMTGLKWLRWEVYRGKRFDSRTRATWRSELPAYIKVAFETVEGRRENWMFEVGWTNGPEPGSVVTAQNSGAGGPPSRGNRPVSVRGRNNQNNNGGSTPTTGGNGGGSGGGGAPTGNSGGGAK